MKKREGESEKSDREKIVSLMHTQKNCIDRAVMHHLSSMETGVLQIITEIMHNAHILLKSNLTDQNRTWHVRVNRKL